MSIINMQQKNFVFNSGAADVKNTQDSVIQKPLAMPEKAASMPIFVAAHNDSDKQGVKFDEKYNYIHYITEEDLKSYYENYVKPTMNQVKESTNNGDGLWAGIARKAGFNKLADFLRDDWAGETLRKIGLNKVADWLEDKDKVCTDGKDDGKLSFKETITCLAKGLLGGIPKMLINHPLATLFALGFGAVAGGSALLLMCASGLIVGAGAAGYGLYKTATAKNDAEKKMALETLGTGVATTVLSAASVSSALRAASEAGVQSAQVAEDANLGTKIVQTFKAVPESIKLSAQNLNYKYNIFVSKELNSKGYVVKKNYWGDAYKKYDRGISGSGKKFLTEERTPGGIIKNYKTTKGFLFNKRVLVSEQLPNGTTRIYGSKPGIYRKNTLIDNLDDPSWFEKTQVSKPQKYLKKSINLSTKQVRKLSVSGSSVNGVRNIPTENPKQSNKFNYENVD